MAGRQQVDGGADVASQAGRRTEQFGGHLGATGFGEDGDDPFRLAGPAPARPFGPMQLPVRHQPPAARPAG